MLFMWCAKITVTKKLSKLKKFQGYNSLFDRSDHILSFKYPIPEMTKVSRWENFCLQFSQIFSS